MVGHILVNAKALMAIEKALVADDVHEAYHILRMQADPNNRHALAGRDHFAQWKRIAEHAPDIVL